MSDESKAFLEKYLPETLNANTCNEILDVLYEFIDDHGFEPPEYYDYNELGVEAQKVYDDIYFYNAKK